MKIGFFEVSKEEEKNYFQQNLASHELFFFKESLVENFIPEQKDFDIISVFIHSTVTPPVIDTFPNLKAIAVRATGFDNIDLGHTKLKNISVSNVPSYGSHTVAEFTFGLILNLSRKINLAVSRVKIAADFSLEGLQGFDLNGKTLGVVGTGKIGSNVIKIAKGFNMKVLAADSYPNEDLAKELDFTYVPLEELLKNSDIVTIHVPLTEETKYLINRQNIFLMKKGSLLINTSRGAVVETDALFQALTKQHLAGAALDVLEEEKELKEEAELLVTNNLPDKEFKTILENHILINLPHSIITPHLAFYSKEAELAIFQTTIENIKAAILGTPKNLVKCTF